MTHISRRKFLVDTAGAATAAAAIAALPRWAAANPLGLPIGLQLYVVNGDMQKDAASTVKKVAEIGYKEVEPAGFGSLKTAKELRKALDDNGLKCPSAHLQFRMDALNATFDDAHELGCVYATASVPRMLILPPMRMDISAMSAEDRQAAMAKMRQIMRAPMTADDFKRLAEAENKVGEAAKAAGLKFAVHNHTMEFVPVDGMLGYDYLITHTEPSLVTFETDCGWMVVAGSNPVDFVNRYPGRIRMLHIKDFLKPAPGSDPERPLGCELGQGFVDTKAILEGMRGKGIEHYFVEQEGPYVKWTPMEAAEADYKYLHSLS